MTNSVVSTVKPAADNSKMGNNIKNSRKNTADHGRDLTSTQAGTTLRRGCCRK
jgi:hypothetical protein